MDDFIVTFSSVIPQSRLQTLKEDKGTKIYKAGEYEKNIIEEYFDNGIIRRHSNGYKLEKIWRIKRPKAEEIFYARGFNRNRRVMLWHGTKAENVVGILKDGFLIRASRGGMFGEGIYFADRASKSMQYCGNTKVLFLCEVSVGKMFSQTKANSSFTSAPVRNGVTYDSVKGVGNWIPDPSEEKKLGRAFVFAGRTVRNTRIKESSSLNYNEYIIYDENRVLLKHIVTFDEPKNMLTITPTIKVSNLPLKSTTTNRPASAATAIRLPSAVPSATANSNAVWKPSVTANSIQRPAGTKTPASSPPIPAQSHSFTSSSISSSRPTLPATSRACVSSYPSTIDTTAYREPNKRSTSKRKGCCCTII